jgi:methionyl-tRNA synthetase
MSAGVELPKRVFGHGFLFNKGEKMSKSVGNVIDPFTMVEHYGLDQVRYFFLREVPFGKDGNYSHEAIVNRINADLANDLGNLAQRSLAMIAKNCAEQMPQPGELSEEDRALLTSAAGLLEEARAAIENQELHRMLNAIWAVVADANRYFASQEPWALKKTDSARMGTVLWVTAETIRRIAILVQPVMPEAMTKLLDAISVPQSARDFAHLDEAHALKAGDAIPKPSPIFPRYVEEGEGA